jgi:hypothetical protein
LVSLTGTHGHFKFEDRDQFKFVDFGIFATSVINGRSKVDDAFLQLAFSVFPDLACSRRIWQCNEFYPEMSPDLNIVFSSLEESSHNLASHFTGVLE